LISVATYPTPSELASWLQKDLDTASATLVLAAATAEFVRIADTAWVATSVTWTAVGYGQLVLAPPFKPITALSAVRVNGVAITGTTLVKNKLYRQAGFGTCGNFPPDEVAVDLVHGITVDANDVKGAILETAAQAYDIPVGAVTSESIDDYAVRYATTGGGLQLTKSAQALAEGYRGPLAA
jgi:hypothetical protein